MTTVLFGDLVGFTALSDSRDPEEVRALLSEYFSGCRTVIARYGGTVEKFIGDAVMAVWGVPTAHEDDAERAVRAGLELLQVVAGMGVDLGAPEVALRVGVVTGEVAVTVGATGEGMVAGDAVNTASRVQSVAESGQVWVDSPTRARTSAAITYLDAGDHLVKGKAEPLSLWRAKAVVAEVGGGQRVDGLEAPLAGRFRELRLLKELYHATEEALRPRLVVLDGGPGVGKSRLAWEFEKYVDGLSATAWWHRGRCLSYGEGVAFWALAEAIRGRLGLVESDSVEVVGLRLDERLAELVTDSEEREWLRPRLAVLLGAGPADGFGREDLFAVWATFFELVGRGEHAVVLVVDDAQHADDGLLDFVDYLLETARAGIFVLALARPELLARRPELGGRRTTVLRLQALDEAAMAELVDGLVVGLPPTTRAALVERAEGVPLFAVETVRALIDRDAVIPRNGQYVPAEGIDLDLAAIGAPASLQALIAARLDALSPQERHVVTAASVLGLSFTREGLDAVSGGAQDLDVTLASLQRKEILELQQDRLSAARGQYRFVQTVVRQVAYATQSRRDRKSRHLIAAEHLSNLADPGDDLAVVIAQHLLDAVDASATADADTADVTGRACALLERAAARASALGSPAEAERLLANVLARTSGDAERARLHLALGEAATSAGHYEQAIAYAELATAYFSVHGGLAELGAAGWVHATALMRVQDNAAAIEVAEPLLATLGDLPGGEQVLFRLEGVLSTAYANRGDRAAIQRYAGRMVALAEATGDPAALSQAHNSCGIGYGISGSPATALVMFESSRKIAQRYGLAGRLAKVLINVTTFQVSRDLGAAVQSGKEACEAARRSGDRDAIDYAASNYLLALWLSGQLQDAKGTLATALETVVEAADRMMLTAVETWLADACGVSLPTFDNDRPTDFLNSLAWQQNLRISRALATGDAAGAAVIADQSLPVLLSDSGLEDDFVHLWPPIVLAAIAAQDVALTERLLDPVTSAPPALVPPAVNAQLRRLQGLLGVLRGDDPAHVEAELRAGIEALDAFGAVGFRAQAEEELGRWLVKQERYAEAKPLFAQAGATYAEIGALGWAARLDTWRDSNVASVPNH